MRGLSILTGALIATVSAHADPAPTSAQHGYRDAVILFGAHWCAPCMAEYRRLPELAAAAAPDHLVLAWIDHPVSGPLAAAADVASLSPEAARLTARSVAGEGYGLPFSAMFDARGAVCAIRRAPLRPDDLADMRAQCGRPRHADAGGSPYTASTK